MKSPKLLCLRGKLYDLESMPLVMGILNHTPDSFYSASRVGSESAIVRRIEQILQQGATLIDVGGYSSRPDAGEVSIQEEWARVREVLEIIRRNYPEALVSVDTFRAEVALRAVNEYGVDMINDVSGGKLDPLMFDTIAALGVPYVLMHMRGTPRTMQSYAVYAGRVADEVIRELAPSLAKLTELGVKDVVVDPGFGFSKTIDQNYELMADLDKFEVLDLPLLVGISRKSMIYRYFDTTPEEALNGTTVLHTYSLLHGAHILRVHDVREAVEALAIVQKIRSVKAVE